MAGIYEDEYWVPEHVRGYLRGLGFRLPLEAMEPHIRAWDRWMRALGDFYDYRDTDGAGRRYEVHRRSIHPAMRVCREWGSLLLNDKTTVACDDAACSAWLARFLAETGFMASAQATVVRAFGLGTGAWALWVDADAGAVRVRHYDGRMVIPLTWDEDGVSECAFVTRAFYSGRAVDQVQMHLRGDGVGCGAGGDAFPSPSSSPSASRNAETGANPSASSASSSASHNSKARSGSSSAARAGAGTRGFCAGAGGTAGADAYIGNAGAGTYRIVTVCFDESGNVIEPEGVCADYDTGSAWPSFAIVKPAIDNTRVDMSPYGQSVFADAVDAIQAVDLAFDAMISEIDNGKMRVFLSDVLFDVEAEGSARVSIPFGRQDCTVFRKVKSVDDVIQEFAPALRTEAQVEAFRVALQMLGDLCGFGITYFDFDAAGYVKTATEVSADNSALMRNIRRHEHVLAGAVAGISHAVLAAARRLGAALPDEGEVRVGFDDSIITDTSAEKRLDMDEVAAGLMDAQEYRRKWHGADGSARRELDVRE